MYGEGYDEVLEQKAKEIKKFLSSDLEEIKEYFKEKIRILEEL